jgi:phage terminase large subunit
MDKTTLKDRLKNLSLEQKQELLKSLKQKELIRQEKVLETFQPHAGQEGFLKAPQKIRAMFSGNGFGKTTALAVDLIYAHTESHPYRDTSLVRHSWFLISGFDKAEDYWNEIKRWCPPSKLPTVNKMGTSAIKRLEWPNGSITTFYSHDQDAGKLEGTNIDALYCDEPPPRDLWIAAYRGLRNNPDYYIVIAGTPISEPWMYEEIYMPWHLKKDPNIYIIQGSTYENPYLSKQWIKDFEGRLTEDERASRIHGEFSHLAGRVFKEFSRKTHVYTYQKWPEEWPVYMAVDPHPRKPHTALWLGVTADDTMVVVDELSVEGDIESFANAIKEKEKDAGYKIVCRRIDNSGSGTDWNRDSFVSELARLGIRTSPMRKAEKDVASSLQKIKLLLKNNQLRFLENCVLAISDMELYAWQDYRNPSQAGVNEKPRKIHDDFIDPLRYIIVSNPVHSPSLSVISTLNDRNPYNKNLPRASHYTHRDKL